MNIHPQEGKSGADGCNQPEARSKANGEMTQSNQAQTDSDNNYSGSQRVNKIPKRNSSRQTCHERPAPDFSGTEKYCCKGEYSEEREAKPKRNQVMNNKADKGQLQQPGDQQVLQLPTLYD